MKDSKVKEQKRIVAKDKQKTRMVIANTVKRYHIDNSCFNCKRPGKILYNFDKDPYKIVFICDNCRKLESALKIADENRKDLRKMINEESLNHSKGKQIKRFSEAFIKKIIEKYLSSTLSIGKYCEKNNISRYKFSQMIAIYETKYPKVPIRDLIDNKSRRTQKVLIQSIKDTDKILSNVK